MNLSDPLAGSPKCRNGWHNIISGAGAGWLAGLSWPRRGSLVQELSAGGSAELEIPAQPHSHDLQWVPPGAGCFYSPRCLASREPDLRDALGGAPEELGAHDGERRGSLCVGVGGGMGLGFLGLLCCLAFRWSPMLTHPLLTRARRVPSTRWCKRSSTTRCAR